MELAIDKKIINLDSSFVTEIETLLRKCGLPSEDCIEHLNNFYGMSNGNRLITIGALQFLDSVALLRSVAVATENRGQGLAAAMTRYLIEVARLNKMSELYLLTKTAEYYFTRFGFSPVERDRVPDGIKLTRQFASLCPSSAQAMRLFL